MSEDLSKSLAESISEEATTCMSGLLEVGLDSMGADGLVKDIPIISTAISIYRIGSTIKERHYVKKLVHFIDEVNKQTASDEAREKYKAKLHSDTHRRNQEIEYIMILIDRYLSCQKTRMLARLYISFLDRKLDWNQLTMYAEVIDHLLPGDYNILQSQDSFIIIGGENVESIIRLVSLGLVAESDNHGSIVEDCGNGRFAVTDASMDRFHRGEKCYYRTAFGSLMVSSIGRMDV